MRKEGSTQPLVVGKLLLRLSKVEKVLATQLCPILCYPKDCNLPGSSLHGILQAKILEWEAIPFSRGSFWHRDWIWVSPIAGRFFTVWDTREDCCHEIKRRLFLGRKAMTNLNSILKSKDTTLLTKVHIVKAMVFPVVMYGCERWTTKKA